ncbi:MAG: 3-hydroxyacyl-ACP dehydratase FabZ family protein [Pseudomonadota bacterium]|nr:3-hydroxyacyl-ACP dehydratase FabZ family protein [Pseudomonadota bacterium]
MPRLGETVGTRAPIPSVLRYIGAAEVRVRWRWVDCIDDMELGTSARGRVTFPADSFFFADHFPGFPVVPGVILLEAMAQLSGKLIGYSVRKARGDWPFPIITMANAVKFRRFVRPEEVVELLTQVVELRDESAIMFVRAKVDGKVVAQAEEIFVFNAVRLESAAESARLEALERAELLRLWPGYPGD